MNKTIDQIRESKHELKIRLEKFILAETTKFEADNNIRIDSITIHLNRSEIIAEETAKPIAEIFDIDAEINLGI